jgi:hypothetical protein
MLLTSPKVISIAPLPEHRLLLEFSNGERRIFDLSSYLSFGIFAQLREPAALAAARIEYGSVEWPIGAGLSYDTLYIDSTRIDEMTSGTAA